MQQVTLTLTEEEEATLSARAGRLGTDLGELATDALRAVLREFAALPRIAGPINVPADFDWTKNSSWYDLIERSESEERATEAKSVPNA